MKLAAAEQLFERPDGGVSSLLWIDHPLRPVILLVHDYGHWRGWPDTWDGQPVEELKDDWDLSYGWELTDSRGRTLRLLVRPARWIWLK